MKCPNLVLLFSVLIDALPSADEDHEDDNEDEDEDMESGSISFPLFSLFSLSLSLSLMRRDFVGMESAASSVTNTSGVETSEVQGVKRDGLRGVV